MYKIYDTDGVVPPSVTIIVPTFTYVAGCTTPEKTNLYLYIVCLSEINPVALRCRTGRRLRAADTTGRLRGTSTHPAVVVALLTHRTHATLPFRRYEGCVCRIWLLAPGKGCIILPGLCG